MRIVGCKKTMIILDTRILGYSRILWILGYYVGYEDSRMQETYDTIGYQDTRIL